MPPKKKSNEERKVLNEITKVCENENHGIGLSEKQKVQEEMGKKKLAMFRGTSNQL